MENDAGNSSRIKHLSKEKFNEENGDLWSLFDIRLSALCQSLLTKNASQHVTGLGRSEENCLDSRPKQPRLITVKSAKCQADLITRFQVPKETNTAWAKVSRPKRRSKAIPMETLPSDPNRCSEQNNSDILLPELVFNDAGVEVRQLDIIKNIQGSGKKSDDRQDNVVLIKQEDKVIRTGWNKHGAETEVCNVGKIGVNGSIVAQFRGQTPTERTSETRDSTAKLRSQKKLTETEFPQELNNLVDTGQLSQTKCLKVPNKSTPDTNEISEPECLQQQALITVDMNQTLVNESELSKECKNKVQMNKISETETETQDHTPDYKKHKGRTERKCKDIQDNHKNNNVSEAEPLKTLKARLSFRRNRDKPINEAKRNNKSERESTEELDHGINYKNVANETRTNIASKEGCRDAEDARFNDNSISEREKKILPETTCTEELDNAANERISKAGCKEEQDNIANDEKHTTETLLTEQQNHTALYATSVSEMHENSANEMYKDSITHRNNTSETEFTKKLENASKISKINGRDSSETASLAEWDVYSRFLKLSQDNAKEAPATLTQSQNMTIKGTCSPKEEAASQMLKLDELSTRELAMQLEICDCHKTGENKTTAMACVADGKHKEQQHDKSQQHECNTREKSDKFVTESEAQQEQKTSESGCRVEHEMSQPERRRESELNTGQIKCRKQDDISQSEHTEAKYDISQPEYIKEPQLNTGQTECRKQTHICQPEYKDVKYDVIQPEHKRELEIHAGQIECTKHNDTSQSKYRKEKDLDTEQIEHIQEHNINQPKYKQEHKIFQQECTTDVGSNNEDIDNDWKLITQNNLETAERHNNTHPSRNNQKQITQSETADLEETNSGEEESQIASSKAKYGQEKTKEIITQDHCRSANNRANIEAHFDILKRDDNSTCSESYQLPTGPPELAFSDYGSEVCDHCNTEKSELSDSECQEVSINLPTRNENAMHQVAENCYTGTRLPAFEADTQATITERVLPLHSILAKRVATSDSVRKMNQTHEKTSTSHDDPSCARNENSVLLPPLCNWVTENPTCGISGRCIIATVLSNCTNAPAQDNRAIVPMISRQVSAYILDTKMNTARIVPLDSCINYTLEQADSRSAVICEDIHFQNGRLLCWNSEARPRRVSSTDCKSFQSNPMETLCSGLTRRSRSESLVRRCTLNKEWEVLTKTTREEITIFSHAKQSTGKTKERTISCQESRPKCSVIISSNKLQHSQTSQVQSVHENINQQPFCLSVSANKKSNGNSMQLELGFSQSEVYQELSVNKLTSVEKPCSSTGTKARNDVSGSSAVKKSAKELVSGAMHQCTKELTVHCMPKTSETQTSIAKSSISSFDVNTSSKLLTKALQQNNVISLNKTNETPMQLQVSPETCLKSNQEKLHCGSTVEPCFKTEAQTSEFCAYATAIFADLNSIHGATTKTERDYHSNETELPVANDSSEIPPEMKPPKSHLIENNDKSFGGQIESYPSHANTISCDLVEVIDLTNFKMKDVVIRCNTNESREVFTQTETNNVPQQGQLIVTKHTARSISDFPSHSVTEETKFKDSNFAPVDSIRLQQNVYSKVHPTKYIQDEKTRNNVEKLDFIQHNATSTSTSTDGTKVLQTEIRFGGLIAKELAGYIFCKDTWNSTKACRTNTKREIRRSSSLTDVQTDLQNTLVISEKLRTLLETGQTVLVLKLPPADRC